MGRQCTASSQSSAQLNLTRRAEGRRAAVATASLQLTAQWPALLLISGNEAGSEDLHESSALARRCEISLDGVSPIAITISLWRWRRVLLQRRRLPREVTDYPCARARLAETTSGGSTSRSRTPP